MASKKLVDRFIQNKQIDGKDGLYTRLKSRLPVRFGVHQASHTLIIRHTTIDPVTLTQKSTDSKLVAHHISTVDRGLIGLSLGGAAMDGIQVAANDWQVQGVPRSYSRQWLTKDVQWFCLDPELNTDGSVKLNASGDPIGGTMLKLILLQDKPKNYLAWDMVMREFSDRSEVVAEHICY
jgi:hypothetical protein